MQRGGLALRHDAGGGPLPESLAAARDARAGRPRIDAFGETNDVIFQLALEDWWVEGGRMTATIVEEGLSGSLDGVMRAIVRNEDGRGNRAITCTAPDHGVVFSR